MVRWKLGALAVLAAGGTVAAGVAAWSYLHGPKEEAGWTGIEACIDSENQFGSGVQVWPLADGPPVREPNGEGAGGIWLMPTWIQSATTVRPLNAIGPAYEDIRLPAGKYLIQRVRAAMAAIPYGDVETVEVHDGAHVIWGCPLPSG